jgi:uncharacterized membrane protein required for colicin V production
MDFTSLTILDGVLAIIILVGVFLGYAKGFFSTITKPVKIIGAGCITYCLANPIIEAWTRPFFTEKAYGWINNALLEKAPELSIDTAGESLPFVLRIIASIFKIDVTAAGEAATSAEIISEISKSLSVPTGNLIAVAVTYAALFIAVLIVLSILIAIIGTVIDSGPLAVVDKILGLILGTAIAIVVCCIVANVTGSIAKDFTGGFVYDFFKNFDPFSLILSL